MQMWQLFFDIKLDCQHQALGDAEGGSSGPPSIEVLFTILDFTGVV